MKPTTLCPCGSGKPQARCCGENAKTKINLRVIVIWSSIILVGSAITVIAFNRPSGETPITNVGATPAPYEYDPITNRHWDPSHAHWHNGAAPAGAGAANTPIQLSNGGDPLAPAINPTISTSPTGTNATSGTAVPAPPGVTNPTPWQYDAATDRYYDSNHGHWHSGRSPTDPSVAAPSNIPSATAWQYDAATDRHFDPDHGHWHSGFPPVDPALVETPGLGDRVPAPPKVTNPQPWQYDAATDRHYNPGHGHWHAGPPSGGN